MDTATFTDLRTIRVYHGTMDTDDPDRDDDAVCIAISDVTLLTLTNEDAAELAKRIQTTADTL